MCSSELLIKCGNVLACTSGWASQVGLVVTQMPMQRDTGSVLGLRRSSEEGHGNPLQHSCMENPMDRGAWGATVYEHFSRVWLKQLSTHVVTWKARSVYSSLWSHSWVWIAVHCDGYKHQILKVCFEFK